MEEWTDGIRRIREGGEPDRALDFDADARVDPAVPHRAEVSSPTWPRLSPAGTGARAMNRAPRTREGAPGRQSRSGDYAWSGRARRRAPRADEPETTATPGDGTKERAAFEYYHRLRRVKEHVERTLTDDISLTSAARVAGLEAKYFSSYFRQKTGRCFKHWLAEMRIDKAMDMMASGDYTISEVAYAVGFRDLRTFERTFKKYTGITPRAYRSSVRPA